MVKRYSLVRSLVMSAVVLSPGFAYAQEAVLSGTVTDATAAVLPGVVVRAQNDANGNSFEAVTDQAGAYRIALRIGRYRVTAELQGFSTATRTVELLVGQNAVINLQLALTGIAESVNVTGEAPLVDTTSSSFGNSIDSRQMESLPIQGRDWMALALLAPGNHSNAPANPSTPGVGAIGSGLAGNFQINVDGQQVTDIIGLSGNFGNPKFSRDAIAEFEFVANRFDATQGRSVNVQVNAVTKSGTNNFTGTAGSYFRDSKMNAADPVTKRALPYSDQQISVTYGGPIRKDRVHFFANYEFEREPQTFTYATPYPQFNFDQTGTRREHTGGGRLDIQFSPSTHLAVRGNAWRNRFPYGATATLSSATLTPAQAQPTTRELHEVNVSLTKVLTNRAVSELRGGYAQYGWNISSLVRTNWPAALQTPAGARVGYGSPRIALRGLTIGQNNQFSPQIFDQKTYSLREDFTSSFTAYGRHDAKFGGEVLHYPIWNFFCNLCFGQIFADIAPRPANLPDLFPNLFDSTTWNLTALSPITYRVQQGVGDFVFNTNRSNFGGWMQDDWKVGSHVTLNLGVRYDLQHNVFVNDVAIEPFFPGHRDDTNNVAPRLGVVYTLNDRTAVRGGFGKFYGEVQNLHFVKQYSQVLVATANSDGRADFAANPFNGPVPTYAQALANVCTPSNPTRPGCILRSITNTSYNPNAKISYSYQSSMGVERQIGANAALSVDYLFTGGREEPFNRNINLSYNPATGANYPSADVTHRPYPDWGPVVLVFNEGHSNLHSLETSLKKRFSQHWQGTVNYSLAVVHDATGAPKTPFPLARDMGGEYTLAAGDQRHRVVGNGIWDVGRGFQVSGIYFYGSGVRMATTYGADLRDQGSGTGNAAEQRVRPDGTIIPRNSFIGRPIHRVDMRLQQAIKITARRRVQGIAEIFNLFNHANYGSYTLQENSPAYGRPQLNQNIAYSPRALQLGIRVAF